MAFCLRHFGIQLEKVRNDFGFGRVGREVVGDEDGTVVRRVCGAEVGRHRERIVEVG